PSDRKAFTKASWAISSAAARSRPKRQARLTRRACQRRTIPSKASGAPASTRAASAASTSPSSIRPFCAHWPRSLRPRLHFLAPGPRRRKRNPGLPERVTLGSQGGDMSPNNLALFIFLATLAVAVFAFLSVGVWVSAQHQDRKSRDRFALLKTLAEQPGENAKHVLDMLREQEARQAAERESQERRGYLMGGLTV